VSSATPWTVLLGHAADGSEVWQDLSKAPHVLLCGTSGSGKSVGVNALLAGLVSGGTPQDTQIVIADQKRVEFGLWRAAPHVARVATARADILGALQGAVAEMDRRYAAMESAGVADVAEWHGTRHAVPRLFVVCDELADLTMKSRVKAENQAAADVLAGLTRIAQLGRAAGVHLIVATQRPAADTLPGNLRANLGTRWAFRVRTRAESRIALDAPGAEELGSSPGTSLLSWRGGQGSFVQGLFVSREDCTAVAEAARARYGARSGSGGLGGSSGRVDVSGWLESLPAPVQIALAVAGGTYGAWALGWLG
jgi:S-DNA-T family DNA segregation ATPase FtsK/SpoIIIE